MRLVPPRSGMFLLLLALGLSPERSHAQCPGLNTPVQKFAEETLTVNGVVKAFTPSVYQPAGITPTMAKVTVEGGDIRYFEVNTPSTGFGHRIVATPPRSFLVCGIDSILGFKAINITASATITITYYKSKGP